MYNKLIFNMFLFFINSSYLVPILMLKVKFKKKLIVELYYTIYGIIPDKYV